MDELRILFVEDLPSDSMLIKHALTKAGLKYKSELVETKNAFIKQLDEFSPDIVLSDYSLPEFDGMQAIDLVKEITPDTPIVIITGTINEETAVECIKRGATDYILKGNLTRIGAAVTGALEKKQAEVGQKQAEKELVAMANQWQVTFNAMKDGIAMMTPESEIIMCNQAMIRLLGKSEDEIIGRKCHEIVHGCSEHVENCPHVRMLKSLVSESVIVNENGRHFQVSTDPVLNENGDLVMAVHTMTDITESKQMEEQLQQAVKMEAIGRLAGGVAHDFNNHLTVIMTLSSFLIESMMPNDPRRKQLQEIEDAANRSAALTQQLLAFSKKQVVQPIIMNINEVVKGMEQLTSRLIGENIKLVSSLEPGLKNIKADPGQIEHVIINLIVNARDALHDGGELSINTANIAIETADSRRMENLQPGPYVKITVNDTGCGMDRKTLARIFEPFFSTKTKEKGTGLGLATSYGIVRQNGGSIQVYSQPDSGSTFNIFLPVTEGEVEVVRYFSPALNSFVTSIPRFVLKK